MKIYGKYSIREFASVGSFTESEIEKLSPFTFKTTTSDENISVKTFRCCKENEIWFKFSQTIFASHPHVEKNKKIKKLAKHHLIRASLVKKAAKQLLEKIQHQAKNLSKNKKLFPLKEREPEQSSVEEWIYQPSERNHDGDYLVAGGRDRDS